MSLGPADGGSLDAERGNGPQMSGNSEWRQQHDGLWLFSDEIQNTHAAGFPGCRTQQRLGTTVKQETASVAASMDGLGYSGGLQHGEIQNAGTGLARA
jgi:hypothetical protein